MVGTTRTILAALVIGLVLASPAAADHKKEPAGCGDGYPLGFGLGWTNKYFPVYNCPGWQHRPWNPLHGTPIHSGLGQTGPRKMLLWPPQVGSPLYNNTPMLVPYPPEARPCRGVNCPY